MRWCAVLLYLGSCALPAVPQTSLVFTGTVSDREGNPLAGVDLAQFWLAGAKDPSGFRAYGASKTDASGAFELEVSKPHFPATLLMMDAERHRGAIITIPDASAARKVTVRLQPLHRVQYHFRGPSYSHVLSIAWMGNSMHDCQRAHSAIAWRNMKTLRRVCIGFSRLCTATIFLSIHQAKSAPSWPPARYRCESRHGTLLDDPLRRRTSDSDQELRSLIALHPRRSGPGGNFYAAPSGDRLDDFVRGHNGAGVVSGLTSSAACMRSSE
jgi:hypothetical protein